MQNSLDGSLVSVGGWAGGVLDGAIPSPIELGEQAVNKILDLLAEEGNPNLKLRVFVQGGGCSGFQYGFTFDEIQAEDDTTVQQGGVTLLVDPMSLQYLGGARIDYKVELMGSQFVVHNPNAVASCGCGSSFAV